MAKELFLQIGSGQQTAILRKIKEHSELGWSKIAAKMKVKRRMIFLYLKEKNRLPMNRLVDLCKHTDFDLEGLKGLDTVQMSNFGQKKIRKPELDEGLAEFLGALSGDGNVDPKNHRVSITCNAISDYEYVTIAVRNMFTDLFGAQTTVNVHKGDIRCQIYSKELADFLEGIGFPKGKRKNRTFIPVPIFENEKFLRAFLRGVFDTDGSFHRKRKNSAVVEFISRSPKFLLQIKKALIHAGLKATLSGKSVYIYDQRHVDSFFKMIKPNNPKHCLKYGIFKKTGRVPLHKELY